MRGGHPRWPVVTCTIPRVQQNIATNNDRDKHVQRLARVNRNCWPLRTEWFDPSPRIIHIVFVALHARMHNHHLLGIFG